jgi:AraC family transcriptional regulator, dual regulator of chb operon
MGIQHIRWNELCRAGEAFHIARIEHPQGNAWNLHDHDFYECFWMEGGTGFHEMTNGTVALLPHQLWFVRPEHVHGFRAKAGASAPRFVNLAMQASVVQGFLQRHGEVLPRICWKEHTEDPEFLMLSPGQSKEMSQLLVRVSAEGRRPLDVEWFLGSLVRLLQIHRCDVFPPDMPIWLRESLFMIRQPVHFRLGVPQFVKLCNRSPAHVARLTRQFTGKTPGQWIQQLRLYHATVLLQTTDLSVTEVALEIGMENLSHFHRSFREVHAISPLRYRRLHASGVLS